MTTFHIIYHGDLDGIVSAAIFLNNCKANNLKYILVKWSHYIINDKFIENINSSDKVAFLDVSPPIFIFKKIFDKVGKENIIWIDHHEKPIQAIVEEFGNEFKGVRDKYCSGCLNTWFYFESDRKIPPIIKHVNDYDLGIHEYINTRPFYYGLENVSMSPSAEIYKVLLYSPSENDELLYKIIDNGYEIIKYKDRIERYNLKTLGYVSKFKLNENDEFMECIVVNSPNTDHFIFGDLYKEYDFCVILRYDGEKYSFSLRSHKDKANVQRIAQAFGGNGHEHASGFSSETNPFKFKKRIEF